MKSTNESTIESLKIEYKACLEGYNSRDLLTEDQFTKFIQIFSIFLTVLLAVNIFVNVNSILHIILCVLIGFTGLVAKISLLIGMASTSSCKIALRKRSIEIESCFAENGFDIKFWKEIETRPKFKIEEIFKGKKGHKKDRKEMEGSFFVKSGYILIVVWCFIVFLMAFYGKSLQLVSTI